MAAANSPCAACKFLRRKCTPECIFAPHFPPDQPEKFANVHRVFGASNVQKILTDLNACDREDAVNSLCYEAESRRRDPVYGCISLISVLQNRVQNLQGALHDANKELTRYQELVLQAHQAMGPAAFQGAQPSPAIVNHIATHPMASMMGWPPAGSSFGAQINNPNNTYNPEQLGMAPPASILTEQEQEMIRALGLQQQSQNIRFEVGAGSNSGAGALGFSPNDPPPPLQVSPPPMPGSLDSGLPHNHFQQQLSLQPQQAASPEEHQVQEQESQGENGYGDGETGTASH
ncbi:hypothetical protein MLD38_003162 [Melastoma candidum]|uniref:Uncharacterized protein n=1 Tax=Melastoma candidum TaxID=119954 RepID=A0ACB9S4V6_9MYRT|nr:hypothetical protein MLD38_003162 [Melastoma candidum]